MSIPSHWLWLMALPWLTTAEAKTDLFFVPNRGQAQADVRFMVQSRHLTAYFKQTEILFTVDKATVGFRLLGANPAAEIVSRKRIAGKANFLLGNRPDQWHGDIPIYAEVLYRDIYPGIDMTYGGSNHRLKSEFIVAPGADPGQIRFSYVGVEHPHTDAHGALILKTPGGVLREEAPEAYQQTASGRRRVESRFEVYADGSIGFVSGEYDGTQTLVIDPPISYATYFGGTGMDNATAIATDVFGSVYVAGWSESSDLRTKNPAQANQGGVDAFVAKFSGDGQTLVYCTYLGGGGDDRASGIAVDSAGNAYITGWTNSTDFPAVNAYQRTLTGGRNAFVAKLNSTGNGLLYSTYFGGRGYDSANGIAVDSSGSAYIAGETTSTDLPVRYPYQSSSHGASDAFAMKLLPAGNDIVYSTYLGGWANDRGRAIAVDQSGSAYITGDTFSSDFPTLSAFQATSGGSQDAFVTKLSPSGGLSYSSYLGGSGGTIGLPETGAGIAVDAQGNAYVTGTTGSYNFPLLNALQSTHTGSQADAFVAKVNSLGSLIYSTYLGGSSIEVATAIAVDPTGQVYVAGYTASTDFPFTAAAESANSGGYDGFFAGLSADGRQLLYSMCLGGTGSDAINALAIGPAGVYVAGQTLSGNFPLRNAVQALPAGSQDAFVAKIPVSQTQTSAGWYFVPITPCRVADTRWPTGPFGGPAMAANTARAFFIPSGSCSIPVGAMAYSLNVSVTPNEILGFLAIWPTAQSQPVVSTLNSFDRRAKSNAVIVPSGASGGVNVFVTGSTGVAIDINGYFLPPGVNWALAFYPIAPCRVVDTRLSAGPLGGPIMQAGETRHIPVKAGACGIPANAEAYSANFTVMPWGALDHITVWPSGPPMPATTTLSSPTGSVTSNAVMVGAGFNGAVGVFTTGKTDMIMDVNGYFALPGPGGLAFYGVTPCRVMDTRYSASPLGGPDLRGARTFPVASGPCGLPAAAKAYSLNATVVPWTTLGFLTLWPAGGSIPVVSTLNSFDGSAVANAAIVPTSNGSVNAFATDLIVLILDVNGYFAP